MSRDHSQDRRLPHPLGPKAEELAFGDGHRHIANRDGVVIGLGYVNEVEGAGHEAVELFRLRSVTIFN
jgi:hypothetical protein